MKDELRDRVQALLDEGRGLASAEVDEALEEAGAEARAEAEALARVDAGLRSFVEASLGDESAEAIATRIEQRLDEDLSRIPDPTLPPIFGDEDGEPPKKSDAGAAKKMPRTASGDYSLANLTSLSVKDAPAVKPNAPLRRPPQPQVDRGDDVILESDALGLEELESDRPPAPPPAPRAPLRIGDERASIPSVPSFDLGAAEDASDLPPPVDLEERRKRNRTLFYVGSGLAAAAALLVVVITGVSTMSSEDEAVATATESVATTQVADMEAAADPFAEGQRAAPAPAPTRAGAAADRSASVEAPIAAEPLAEAAPEEVAEEEAESSDSPDDEPEARSRPRNAAQTSERGPRRRRTSRMASAPPMSASSSTMGIPDRDDVRRAMRAIGPAVSACRGTRGGTVFVNITVASSGRVRNAVVEGEFAGTREGSCVARAVRRARLPEFQRDSFSFRYPFQL